MVASRLGASFALHEVHIAVEDQDLRMQAAQRQLLEERVAVVDHQGPLRGRYRQGDPLTGQTLPDLVRGVLDHHGAIRPHLAHLAAPIDERQPGIRVDQHRQRRRRR